MPQRTAPDPSTYPAAWALRSALCAALLLITACALPPRPRTDGVSPPPGLVGADSTALRLRGRLGGPLPGLGGEIAVDLFLRPDGIVRADLRGTRPDGGRLHEVLLWGPDFSLLFDRVGGRFLEELGPRPGTIELLGGVFEVEDLWWLLAARPPAQGRWTHRAGQWRGTRSERGWRRPAAEPPAWAELIWRDPGLSVHDLRAEYGRRRPTPWGPWPLHVALEGADLAGRAVLRIDVAEVLPLADEMLDPLWEPPGG